MSSKFQHSICRCTQTHPDSLSTCTLPAHNQRKDCSLWNTYATDSTWGKHALWTVWVLSWHHLQCFVSLAWEKWQQMSARTPSVCKQTQNAFATCTRKGNKHIYLVSGVKFIRMPKESEQVLSDCQKTREATITPLLLGQGLCVYMFHNQSQLHTYVHVSLSLSIYIYTVYVYIYIYVYVPGTQMTSTFEGQPPPQKKRPVSNQNKDHQRVPGLRIVLYTNISNWLVVSTHLKKYESKWDSSPISGVKMKKKIKPPPR